MYRATAEIVFGSKVFAGGKWLKCIGNKRVSIGERIWTDGRCVYGHFQEAQQPPVITSGGDEAIPILAGKQCYIFYRGKLRLIGELDKKYSLMINDTRGNVFVYDDKTGIRIDGNTRETLLAANIDKAGNHYYLTNLYEIIDDEATVGELRILKNGAVVDTYSLDEYINKVADSVEMPSLAGVRTQDGSGFPLNPFNAESASYFFVSHFIENPQCWSLFQSIDVVKTAENNAETWKWNEIVEWQYLFRGDTTVLGHGRVWWDMTESNVVNHREPANYNSATFALQDGFYCQANPAPLRPWYEGNIENTNFSKSFFSPLGKKILEIDGQTPENSLIARVAGGYLFYLEQFLYDGNISPSDAAINVEGLRLCHWGLYLYKNGTLELIYPSVEVYLAQGATSPIPQWQTFGDEINNQRLRPMKRFKNWHKRIKEINLNQTA